jgi:glucose/mannose-6-phosphate isomerase
MLLHALELSRGTPLPKIKKIDQIVISGMGGSAIAGDIVSDLFFNKVKIPIFVNRNYRLPAFVNKETLFFALSYSGNTEEALSAVKEAAKCGATITCITSGGKLKEIAEANKYALYLIPPGYEPRAALPYLLVPILVVLEKIGFISGMKEELEGGADLLQKLQREYGATTPTRNNPVKQLAGKLIGRIPIIFAASGSSAAAGLRLKTQFNENSKVTAVFNLFPELNHNEIVNLSVLKREEHNFSLIFLRAEADLERIVKRMEITKSLIGSRLGGVNEVWAQGKTPLAKMLSLIYFGDLLSVYLAILRGIDPTPVEIITRLKKELAR